MFLRYQGRGGRGRMVGVIWCKVVKGKGEIYWREVGMAYGELAIAQKDGFGRAGQAKVRDGDFPSTWMSGS